MKLQTEFFDALFDPELPAPLGISTWNGSDPAMRFGIYRNNVVASLIDALADTFPVTQELVGNAFFRAMSQLYVRSSPPHSRVLAFYGETLPAFMEQFPPAATLPYLADVARLEMLRVHAFHAANNIPLSIEAIASVLAEHDGLAELRIKFQPSVNLLHSQYAVASLWAAHQGIHDIATIDPYLPENVLIVRTDLDVVLLPLSYSDYVFVHHLIEGTSLGSAAVQASLADASFNFSNILGLLIQHRSILSLTTVRKTHP